MHPPLAQSGLHQSRRPIARVRLVPARVQHPQRERPGGRPSAPGLGVSGVQSTAWGTKGRGSNRGDVSVRVCLLSGHERVQVYMARQRKRLGSVGAVYQYRSDDQGHSQVDGLECRVIGRLFSCVDFSVVYTVCFLVLVDHFLFSARYPFFKPELFLFFSMRYNPTLHLIIRETKSRPDSKSDPVMPLVHSCNTLRGA